MLVFKNITNGKQCNYNLRCSQDVQRSLKTVAVLVRLHNFRDFYHTATIPDQIGRDTSEDQQLLKILLFCRANRLPDLAKYKNIIVC